MIDEYVGNARLSSWHGIEIYVFGNPSCALDLHAKLALMQDRGRRPLSSLMNEERYMPGATSIGMVRRNGVLLSSERRYAYGTFVMSKGAKKVFSITDNIPSQSAQI